MKIFLLFTFLFISEISHAQWKDESELGWVLTGGNTSVATFNAKNSANYTHDKNTVLLNARYLRSSNQGIENALQWGLGARYEREWSPKLSFFIGQLVESNIYQNILQRYATDLGKKYFFFKTEKSIVWFFEGGYRFARENYSVGSKDLHFVRLYTETEKFWNPTLSGKLYLEYLPNLTEWKGYQANAGVSLSAAFNEVFSMKSSLDLKYNNEPPRGAISNSDRIFTTALVAKF